MNLYRLIDARLRSEEVSQGVSLILLFVSLGLVFSWTGSALTPNDSWYTVTAISRTGLAVVAIYLALRDHRKDWRKLLSSYFVLLLVSFILMPFGLVTFAVSHPAASLAYTLVFDTLFPLGLFGFCLAGARLLPRLPWLSILFSAAIVAVCVVLDELIGYRLFSPITIIASDNWPLLLIWSVPAVATAVLIGLSARRLK